MPPPTPAQKSLEIKGGIVHLGLAPGLSTVVVSGVLLIDLLGDLRLLFDLGTRSGKFGFLGVKWVV
jgi:hypothetical protein